MAEHLASWRIVWRNGFAPLCSTAGLEALADALRSDDRRLVQGATTSPPPSMCVRDHELEACCPVTFTGVPELGGFGEATVGDAEDHFARMCFDADQRLGEPAACRWFLNAWDDTPRDEMRRELLVEVERELAERRLSEAAASEPSVSAELVAAARVFLLQEDADDSAAADAPQGVGQGVGAAP